MCKDDLGYKQFNCGCNAKGKDMRISYIPINSDYMRSTADIPKLYDMAGKVIVGGLQK